MPVFGRALVSLLAFAGIGLVVGACASGPPAPQALAPAESSAATAMLALCSAGDSESCTKAGGIYESKDHNDQAVRAYLIGCGRWNRRLDQDTASEVETNCQDAGRLYWRTRRFNADNGNRAVAYSSFGCQHFKDPQLREDACEDLERRVRLLQQEAAYRAQMANAIAQGMLGIGQTAVQGTQTLDAARRGIVLPPVGTSGAPLSLPPTAPQLGTAGGSAVTSAACGQCASRCEALMSQCKSGAVPVQSACYLAAACLCRCNLDGGGCGSSEGFLRTCVLENESRARQLR